jgi:hypothetical protein
MPRQTLDGNLVAEFEWSRELKSTPCAGDAMFMWMPPDFHANLGFTVYSSSEHGTLGYRIAGTTEPTRYLFPVCVISSSEDVVIEIISKYDRVRRDPWYGHG